jgi:DNA-binding MarR family transcriptional regulator
MGWHIVVTEEMRALGLSGNDLMVFALIYGFSQDGQGCFYGSLNYICETCGISRRTAIYILNDLVERGFLLKEENIQNGVKRVLYQVNRGSAEIAPVVQKLHGGSAKIAPNNIKDNISPTEIINKEKDVRFDFKKSLLEIGVSPQVAEDWLKVRKAKKAANTKTAFERIHTEIMLSGMSADECIRIAVERSWQGFKAEWVDNYRRQQPARPTGRRGVSVLENNRNVAEELLRMSMNMEETS